MQMWTLTIRCFCLAFCVVWTCNCDWTEGFLISLLTRFAKFRGKLFLRKSILEDQKMKGLIHLLMVIGIEDMKGDLNLGLSVLACKEKKRRVLISQNSRYLSWDLNWYFRCLDLFISLYCTVMLIWYCCPLWQSQTESGNFQDAAFLNAVVKVDYVLDFILTSLFFSQKLKVNC